MDIPNGKLSKIIYPFDKNLYVRLNEFSARAE
jgi:hypothetical protein